MKKIKIILFALLLAAVPLLAFGSTTYAGSFHNGANVTIKKGEVIDHTVFAAGNNVDIEGTIKGDLFCAGQNITINATVDGDVICAGMNVDIAGTVSGDVRAAGQVVSLSAKVDRSASLAGNVVKTTSDSIITRDIQTAGNTVTLNGKVTRDADLAGSTITLAGTIGRDVQAATQDLQLDSQAKVNGDLTYYSHNQLDKANGAKVGGHTTRKEPPKQQTKNTNPIPNIIFSFFTLLVFAFVLLALLPRKLRDLTDIALTRPGSTVLIGLAACIGMPIAILICFITVVGALAGIALLLAWIVVLIFSAALASYYTGRLVLMRTTTSPFIAMFVGVLIVSILMLIPIINILTAIAVLLFGTGMVVRKLITDTPKPRYETLKHPRSKKPRTA